MIRRKVRVGPGVDFDAAVREAIKICAVPLEDPKRRYFVAECEDEASLDALRDLGCEITENMRYVLDSVNGSANNGR